MKEATYRVPMDKLPPKPIKRDVIEIICVEAHVEFVWPEAFFYINTECICPKGEMHPKCKLHGGK